MWERKRAFEAFDNRQYETAFETIDRLARANDPEAQHRLGKMYDEGLFVSQSSLLARHWYRAAVNHSEELQYRCSWLRFLSRYLKEPYIDDPEGDSIRCTQFWYLDYLSRDGVSFDDRDEFLTFTEREFMSKSRLKPIHRTLYEECILGNRSEDITYQICSECEGKGKQFVACDLCKGQGKLSGDVCPSCVGKGGGIESCGFCSGAGDIRILFPFSKIDSLRRLTTSYQEHFRSLGYPFFYFLGKEAFHVTCKWQECRSINEFRYYYPSNTRSNGEVVFEGETVNGADPRTFQVLLAISEPLKEGGIPRMFPTFYGRDGKKVFYRNRPMPESILRKVDASSFEVLANPCDWAPNLGEDRREPLSWPRFTPEHPTQTEEYFHCEYPARDKNSGYLGTVRFSLSLTGVWFLCWGNEYHTDSFGNKREIFWGHYSGAVIFGNHFIKGADANSFRVLNENYAIDKHRVYYYQMGISPTIEAIPGSHGPSFEFFTQSDENNLYVYDRKYVYYCGTRVKGAAPKSFRPWKPRETVEWAHEGRPKADAWCKRGYYLEGKRVATR